MGFLFFLIIIFIHNYYFYIKITSHHKVTNKYKEEIYIYIYYGSNI